MSGEFSDAGAEGVEPELVSSDPHRIEGLWGATECFVVWEHIIGGSMLRVLRVAPSLVDDQATVLRLVDHDSRDLGHRVPLAVSD